MESNQPDCYKVDHYGMRCGSNFHQWIPCPGLDLKVKHDTGDWTWSCDCVLITLKKYIDIWHGRFDDGMRKYGMNWIVFGGHCVVIVADNIVADMTLVECQRLKHKHWPMILINCWWCFQTFLFWILVLPALSCFIFLTWAWKRDRFHYLCCDEAVWCSSWAHFTQATSNSTFMSSAFIECSSEFEKSTDWAVTFFDLVQYGVLVLADSRVVHCRGHRGPICMPVLIAWALTFGSPRMFWILAIQDSVPCCVIPYPLNFRFESCWFLRPGNSRQTSIKMSMAQSLDCPRSLPSIQEFMTCAGVKLRRHIILKCLAFFGIQVGACAIQPQMQQS